MNINQRWNRFTSAKNLIVVPGNQITMRQSPKTSWISHSGPLIWKTLIFIEISIWCNRCLIIPPVNRVSLPPLSWVNKRWEISGLVRTRSSMGLSLPTVEIHGSYLRSSIRMAKRRNKMYYLTHNIRRFARVVLMRTWCWLNWNNIKKQLQDRWRTSVETSSDFPRENN